MSKTKEQVRLYNKQYSERPEVIAWAKLRNARPERKAVRKAYKQSERGKVADRRYVRRHWEKNKPLREKHLLWRYGLTPAQYDEMSKAQNALCAICNKASSTRLHVDHHHASKRVRGLLCGSCNRGIGMFRDDPELLRNAINYLVANV